MIYIDSLDEAQILFSGTLDWDWGKGKASFEELCKFAIGKPYPSNDEDIEVIIIGYLKTCGENPKDWAY